MSTMKRNKYIYLLLLALVLCACDEDENWFYHSVKFNGKFEESRLVVTGTLYAEEKPVIYVNQSYFFMDSNAVDTIPIIYTNGRGEEYVDYYPINHRGYLWDAKVEMQVNGGEWMKLVTQDTVEMYQVPWAPPYAIKMPYYTCDYVLHAGDDVNIRVSHDKYSETATAHQRIPDMPEARVANFAREDELVAGFDVTLPAYKGSETDVLVVSATVYGMSEEKYRLSNGYWDKYNDKYVSESKDTVVIYPYIDSYIYSQNLDCSLYTTINEQVSKGYYASDTIGLYLPVNKTNGDKSIHMCTIMRKDTIVYHNDDHYSKLHVDSVVLDVKIVSQDAYLALSSLVAGGYYGRRYVYDPFEGNEVDDFLGDITEIFDEMGMMEKVQVYSNVENAIGHIGSAARQRIVLYRHEEK